METQWRFVRTSEVEPYDGLEVCNVPIFAAEDISGSVLSIAPGRRIPPHVHEHEHEIFDVIAGSGLVWVDGEQMHAGPGTTIFVPAGVEHGFKNDGKERWVMRVTTHRRVYARQALARAVWKRISRVAGRLRQEG